MATRRDFLFMLPGFAAGLVVACSGGGDEGKFPDVQVVDPSDVLPIMPNSEIVVGPNRLVFALLDADQRPIVDAKMHLTFYDLASGTPVKKFEAEGVSRVPSRDAGIKEEIEHIHTDGSRHVHINAGDEIGVYTANVSFDHAGDWGVEMAVESDNPRLKTVLKPRFNVLEKGRVPNIGEPAPRSRNRTVADTPDLTILDTSPNPSAEMHTATIADTIAAGKPLVVLFAAPGYCTSQLCGPEYEIMRKLYGANKQRAEFIHVEFYDDPASPSRLPTAVANEWRLQSEPWFYVIDKSGIIRARFEGPTSLQELEEALSAVTA